MQFAGLILSAFVAILIGVLFVASFFTANHAVYPVVLGVMYLLTLAMNYILYDEYRKREGGLV